MRGFSLIELLLVIAIIAVVAVTTVPFLSNFYLRTNLDTTRDVLVSSIRKAQSYAMDGKDGAAWGICLSGSSIRVFETSCTSPAIKEDYSIPGNISLTGLPTTTFSSGRGEPSATFSAQVTSGVNLRIVQINSAGVLTIN